MAVGTAARAARQPGALGMHAASWQGAAPPESKAAWKRSPLPGQSRSWFPPTVIHGMRVASGWIRSKNTSHCDP